jgi:hypothetical protein
VKTIEKILGWGRTSGGMMKKISMEENDMLEANFTESEIKKSLMIHMQREHQALMVFHLCFIKKIGQQLRMILWI